MKLRTLIIVSVLTVLVIGGASFAFAYHLKHRYDAVALTDVKTGSDKPKEKCLQANKSLKLNTDAQQPIAAAAVRHIKDLPKNSQAGVYVASYEAGKSATGRVSYATNGIGSYNFTLQMHGQEWQVTSFKACNP